MISGSTDFSLCPLKPEQHEVEAAGSPAAGRFGKWNGHKKEKQHVHRMWYGNGYTFSRRWFA
jgi:hypothetical protein